MRSTGKMSETQHNAERQQGFFSILREPQTYRNFAFVLLAAPLGLLHAGLILLGGAALVSLIMVAGRLPFPAQFVVLLLIFPAIGAGVVVICALLRMQARVNARLLGLPEPHCPLRDLRHDNTFAWCGQRLRDRWTWLGLLYLLVITAVGAVSAAITLLFLGLAVGVLGGAVTGDLSAIRLSLGAMELHLPGIRLLMFPVAAVLAIIGFHLANGLAELASRIGELLLGPRPRAREGQPAPALSRAPETAYAPVTGRQASARNERMSA